MKWDLGKLFHRITVLHYDSSNETFRKTLQTISLLSYLASFKGIWGPHLVIVPTSVIINWETELKRFSPALKVLCYYGTAKRRKELRVGWTKTNWFHVVITSYQLAVQDSFAFKRKKWYYMILDEAHNIKNFQSQRWQTLISFNSQRRLLLTGTPLQNNLNELWSLLHFLMPHVFRSRKEFSYWFSNPMNNMIEGNSERSDELVKRLHNIIRPFVLRRLKKDVETQLPGKHEHIIKAQMSRRQMFLYEEFMARSSTRQALKHGGNFMGMMSVLMQLRKVCNHPDLFEPRAVITPFAMESINMSVPHTILECQERRIWDRVSDFLISPLWCCYNDQSSSSESPNCDTIMEEQYLRIRVPYEDFMGRWFNGSIDSDLEPLPEEGLGEGLINHLRETRKSQVETRESLKNMQWRNNERRCNSRAFSYPYRTQSAVLVDALSCGNPENSVSYKQSILSTPELLLTMRRSIKERADDFDTIIQNFAFCVPKAGVNKPKLFSTGKSVNSSTSFEEMLVEPLENFLRPFQKVKARLSSFFPDKRLVQFDAGKLQTLSSLLHELKRGGHRALIFTQMSKMLDILEVFLNLNGHTYLRLDGSTGVERRQRLMDKFNNDEKIFCFILSTRSGGLGINLTGADTVIFYDSDWNPAMDVSL
jgi:SNF2 family DNA or RNA helicase